MVASNNKISEVLYISYMVLHLLGHKQPRLEEKTHPNIYNGKVCECCSQTSKQVNIVVNRMRGPSGPEILVENKRNAASVVKQAIQRFDCYEV